MQSQLPINLKDPILTDLLTRIYTDLFCLFNKTSISDPAAMGNANNEIGGLTFSASPTQGECEALRDKCEELADDVRAIHTSLTALIDTLQERELV